MDKYNHEHYSDSTAAVAVSNAGKMPGYVRECISFMKRYVAECGCEITNRIEIKDKNGKVWR